MSQYENDNPLRFVITFGLSPALGARRKAQRKAEEGRRLRMPMRMTTTTTSLTKAASLMPTTTTTTTTTMQDGHDIYFNDILKASSMKYDQFKLLCFEENH